MLRLVLAYGKERDFLFSQVAYGSAVADSMHSRAIASCALFWLEDEFTTTTSLRGRESKAHTASNNKTACPGAEGRLEYPNHKSLLNSRYAHINLDEFCCMHAFLKSRYFFCNVKVSEMGRSSKDMNSK